MAGSTITTPRITEGPLLELADFVIHGGEVDVSLAEQLLRLPESRAYDLMYAAFLVKRHFVGDALHRCGIQTRLNSQGCCVPSYQQCVVSGLPVSGDVS